MQKHIPLGNRTLSELFSDGYFLWDSDAGGVHLKRPWWNLIPMVYVSHRQLVFEIERCRMQPHDHNDYLDWLEKMLENIRFNENIEMVLISGRWYALWTWSLKSVMLSLSPNINRETLESEFTSVTGRKPRYSPIPFETLQKQWREMAEGVESGLLC